MKSKNFTKEYLLENIRYLSKQIQQYKYKIYTCETCIKKQKKLLNNSKEEHNKLWLWRDNLRRCIKTKQQYEQELKEYQKIYTLKYNYQYKSSIIICI